MNFPAHIAIVDHPDSGSDGMNLTAVAAAMQKSLAGDFAPLIGMSATVEFSDGNGADLILGLFSDPDQPGALGYHSVSPDGIPFGKIFPKLDKQDGANLSTTIDHEAKEAIVDLWCNLAVGGLDGQFWADEPCDAVEQDEFTVDGITLSNFVLPGWYSGVGKLDFLGKLSAPLTVNPGGYAQYFDPQSGWQQITHAEKKPRSYRQREFSRFARRREAHRLAMAKRLSDPKV